MNGITTACFGRLDRDGELTFTAKGRPFASFSVAVEDAKQAEGQDGEWLPAVIWGEQAEELAPREGPTPSSPRLSRGS